MAYPHGEGDVAERHEARGCVIGCAVQLVGVELVGCVNADLLAKLGGGSRKFIPQACVVRV